MNLCQEGFLSNKIRRLFESMAQESMRIRLSPESRRKGSLRTPISWKGKQGENFDYTIPAFRKFPKFLCNLWQAHDVAEHVSSEGRKDTASTEEKVRAVETEQSGVAQLENCANVNYQDKIFLQKGTYGS
jgi:hypothetical protein